MVLKKGFITLVSVELSLPFYTNILRKVSTCLGQYSQHFLSSVGCLFDKVAFLRLPRLVRAPIRLVDIFVFWTRLKKFLLVGKMKIECK